MSIILLTGRWAWAWGIWHALWLIGILWAGAAYLLGLDPVWIFVWFATLYTAFFPMEALGVLGNYRAVTDEEWAVARTLSEVRQFIPLTLGKGPEGVGWKALGYSGVIDGLIVGRMAYEVYPLAGAVIGTLVALWLSPHFGWRERVG